jgi:hypothetical protein
MTYHRFLLPLKAVLIAPRDENEHPKQTLAPLSAILPEEVSKWSYGIEGILVRLQQADAALLKDLGWPIPAANSTVGGLAMSDDTLQRDTSQISQLFHPLPRRFPNAHGRTAAMTADSNFGQRTAATNARVAKLMSHTVEIAGFAFDLNDFPATHTQLSTTNATAMLVIHPFA